MRPILFDKSATNFTTNGIGRLECISCHVVEERNGMYELEAVVPITGEHTADVGMESIIGVIPSDGGTLQAFRVYKVGKPINGKFSVYARHISYLLSDIPTMPFTVSSSPSACANTLAGLKSNAIESCPFNFYTDVTTAASYRQSAPASIRERLGGVEGSVLDQFGGEYEWDNFDVHLWKQRGRLANVTGITLRYGKNIKDINQEEAISNTVTGVVPYWVDTEGNNLVTLPEKVIYSQHSTDFAYHLTQVLDLSSSFEEQPTVAQLRSYANTYVNKSGFGIPKVSIKLSFINLWETEEYKDIAPLERVKLCDEINVEFEKLGITAVAKVVKTDYDVLKERYISIEVGSVRSTLAQAVTDREKEVDSAFLNQLTRVGQQIADATAWLTSANGYVVAVKNTDGSWKELLFMDTNDPSTARNVLRINNNGIGISTNGINGPYSTAWTIDGRFGDAANKNFWNLITGEFRLSAGASVIDQNSNYRGSYVPTNNNSPASSWSASDKPNHVGETFLDVGTNKMYIYKSIAGEGLPKTAHPYANSDDKYWHFTTNLTAPIYLIFNGSIETENNYDYIRFYERSGSGYKVSEQIMGDIYTGTSDPVVYMIDSNEFWMTWHTDSSVQKNGWEVYDIKGYGWSGSYFTPSWSNGSLPSATWTEVTFPSSNSYQWVEASLNEYIEVKASQGEQQELTQEEVYNILTNNGQEQGIFLSGGKLYLNGQYFTANAITIGGYNYSQKPYLEIKDNTAEEKVIGKWDRNGIQADAGRFGNMGIYTRKINNRTYSFLTYGGNSDYIDKEWDEGELTNSNNKGSFTIVPYLEGWDESDEMYCGFSMSLVDPTTSREKAIQCVITITQYGTNGKMSNRTEGGVQVQGSKTFNLNCDGWQTNGSTISDKSGMEGYRINKDWGKNAGEYYQIDWKIVARSSSYTDYVSLCLGDNGQGWCFYLGSDLSSDDPDNVKCIGKFQGYFTGNGTFSSLDLGNWNYSPYDDSWFGKSDRSNRFIRLKPNGVTVSKQEDFNENYVDIGYNSIDKDVNGTWYGVSWNSSDERIKNDVHPLDTELSKQIIDGTQTKSFRFNGAEHDKHYGMIAQEARELLDSLGETDAALEHTMGDTNIEDQRTIEYHEYIPHLINYVRDLKAEIEALKAEIADINRR